jgi:hypothetical protein
MAYSENDQIILLRWQAAKMRHDFLEQWEADTPLWLVKRDANDISVFKEYMESSMDLNNLADPTLAALVKRMNPTGFPTGGSHKTKKGRAILAAADADLISARQELFDISLGIKDQSEDVFPLISKVIQ